MTKWECPRLLLFTDQDKEGTIKVDIDGLQKAKVTVTTPEEAGLQIQNEERLYEACHQVLSELNPLLNLLKEREAVLEASIDPDRMDSLRSSYGEIFEDLARAKNNPLDFTLPWPPTGGRLIEHYRDLVLKAAEEMEKAGDETCDALAPVLLKKSAALKALPPPPMALENAATRSRQTKVYIHPGDSLHQLEPPIPGQPVGDTKSLPEAVVASGCPIIPPRTENADHLDYSHPSNVALREALVDEHFAQQLEVLPRLRELEREVGEVPHYMPSYPVPYSVYENVSVDISSLVMQNQCTKAAIIALQRAQKRLDLVELI